VGDLLEKIYSADAEIALFWCPTEIGVPTVTAYIWTSRPGVGVYKGYGCHLDPEIAMIRAITEAVQARTIFYAGARDDMLRGMFAALQRSDVAGPQAILANSREISIDAIPNQSTHSFHGDVSVILNRMSQAGFNHVFARELQMGRDFEVAVVRVVTPGLEPYRFPWIGVTDRAKNFDPNKFFRA
jgi:ribosomal protein S12 methylthiotransferase accessory factor